ncbi:MAG: LiaF transmembrane domain-containing protein [Actinomycetota bacterium]
MNYGRFFIGTVLVAVGVLLALDAGGVVEAGEIIAALWPLVLVLGAALMYVANPRHWVVPLVILVVAVVILLDTSGAVEVDLWQFVWPAILIGVGLAFILGRTRSTRQATDADRVSQFVMFSGADITSNSKHFAGGSVSAVFGGAEVNLRGAVPAEGASLDVFTAFGGVEIIVPEGWNVAMSGFPLFGGFENATSKDHLEPGAPRLDVSAIALFGGIEVKH